MTPKLFSGYVEESSHCSREALVHVVDEGVEQAGSAMQRRDVVVGYSCGYQCGVALPQKDLIACGTYTNPAITLDTHRDDEAVVFQEIAVEGCGYIHNADIEII